MWSIVSTGRFSPFVRQLIAIELTIKSRLINTSRRLYQSQTPSESKRKEIQNYAFHDSLSLLDIYPKLKRGLLSDDFFCELLMKSLSCTEEEAKQLYNQYPKLKELHAQSVIEVVEFLKLRGIHDETLKRNFSILLQSLPAVKAKFNLISKLGTIDYTFLLLKLSEPLLKKVCDAWKVDLLIDGKHYSNRLEFFQHRFEWEMEQITDYPILLTADVKLLDDKLKVLLNYNISTREISELSAILKLSHEKIEDRLKKATEANIGVLKSWMVLCSDDKFEELLIKWKDLGTELRYVTDLETYLCDRLQCSNDYIRCLSHRFPQLLNIHIQQIKLVLDYLYLINFTPSHVCLTPRILNSDVEQLKLRYAKLLELGYKPQHLHQLIANQRHFEILTSQLKLENRNVMVNET